MNIAIIGATGHTDIVLDGVRQDEGLDVVGVARGSDGESVSDLLRAVREQNPDTNRYAAVEQLLDETEPDVVVSACYFGDLADVTCRALDQGCHVYTEKPVATTVEDLDAVVTAYERSGGELAAMLASRYDPWFRTAHERVAEGAIGEVRLLDAQKSYKLGTRDEPYLSRTTYGGTLPWVGVHAIDWLNWFGDDEFCSVWARHSTAHNRDHGDLEVTAVADFELTDEVFGSVTVDYLRPETAPTHGDDRLRVAGTEGVIEVRDDRVFLINPDADGDRELSQVESENAFLDFVGHVRGESPCLVSAADSFRATEAGLLARRAADEDSVVEFD